MPIFSTSGPTVIFILNRDFSTYYNSELGIDRGSTRRSSIVRIVIDDEPYR